MENKDYIVAIDLGDSNIVVAVGSAAEYGRVNIEHILTRPSEGVSAGQIVNIDLAVKTIRTALAELRDNTGIEVHEAYAGISGEFIYCTSHTDHVFVPDHKNGVTKQVVEALFERMSNVLVSEDRFIMERIPQRYVINDTTEVDDPVGVFGSPLSSTFNFISSDNIPLNRLDMALRRLNITPRKIFSNAVVVGDAVLSPDEKEEGVVAVDLGGELTDIAIYHRNIMRYISTIPMGAKSINNDIRTLTIPERYIEPLKLRYGSAIARNVPQDVTVIIKGRSKHDQREIAVYNLAAVIEARMRDIAELVCQEIKDSGFENKVPYGIVLTGGGAQLRGVDELFREVTGMEVRVAEAEDIISPPTRTRITSSADSTAVGLLLHGIKYGPCAVVVTEPVVAAKPEQPFQHIQHVSAHQTYENEAVVNEPKVIPSPLEEAMNSAAAHVEPVAPVQKPVQRSVQPQVQRPVQTPVPEPVATPTPTPEPVARSVAQTAPKPTPAPRPVYTPSASRTMGGHAAAQRLQREESEPMAAPVTISNPTLDTPEEDSAASHVAEQPTPQPAAQTEAPKAAPKRILKLLDNWVKKVNNKFDVNEEV